MPATSEAAASFVADGVSAFERAYSSSSEQCERRLRLAGCTVRLRIAGAELARRLTPALAHLETPTEAPVDLSIGCWDRSATGIPPPAPPGSNEDFLARGRVRGLVHQRIRLTYDRWMRMICAYDRDRGEAWVHVADADLLPPWIDRAPLRAILTWWASDRDLVFLHASAVANGRGAVALAGGSGAGKSTTALACFAAGMAFLGDDACLVRLDPPVANSVFGFAKLEPDAVVRLPALADLPQRCRDGQTVIEPGEAIRREAPLRAVLLTHVGADRDSQLQPLGPAEALRGLVASSLLEGGGASGGALPALSRLVQQVPCYRLELGSDLDDVVATVQGVLDSVVTLDARAVSVVMPVRDGERYIAEALESILGQSEPPGEVVVVDDGSTDSTPLLAAGYGSPVTVLRRPALGQFAAMNAGIEASAGELLAFLDADDVWTPGSLESRLARIIEDDEPEAVFGRTVQFVSPELDADMHRRFRFDPGPVGGTLFQVMLIRRPAFLRVGLVAVDYRTSANIDWMSRARAVGLRSVEIPDVVGRRRLHGGNVSIQAKDSKQDDLLRVVRAHVHRTHRQP